MKRGRGSVRAVDCRLWSVDCGLPAHGFGSAMPKSQSWSEASSSHHRIFPGLMSKWRRPAVLCNTCRAVRSCTASECASRWTTDSGLLTRTNMKQATSAWGAIKVFGALRSEIKPSYINRLAPLLRIHTAKSKRRRLGRRLCSAAGRASNARRCGLWTLDYRPHPFINKNHTTITWMIDWMLSMHPIQLRCWPRVQTQNSAKMMKTRWQMAAVLADGAAHRKKIKNVRNGNLVYIMLYLP